MDIDNDGNINSTLPILYNGLHQYVQGTPSTASGDPSSQKQVYTMTAPAVLPNGAKRILREDVAMKVINFTLPGALTLVGNSPSFNGPNSVSFVVNGDDNSPGGSSCPPIPPSRAAVGVVRYSDIATTVSGIPLNRLGRYTGGGLTTPSVSNMSSALTTDETTPSGLEKAQDEVRRKQRVIDDAEADVVRAGSDLERTVLQSNVKVAKADMQVSQDDLEALQASLAEAKAKKVATQPSAPPSNP